MTIIHTLNKKIHCNHYLTHVKTNTSKTCNPNHNILLAFKYQCETRTGEEKKKKKETELEGIAFFNRFLQLLRDE